jgi:hypothetical protein
MIEPKALTLASRKIAMKVSGDARRALQLMQFAFTGSSSFVLMDHIYQPETQLLMEFSFASVLQCLPVFGKVFLFSFILRLKREPRPSHATALPYGNLLVSYEEVYQLYFTRVCIKHKFPVHDFCNPGYLFLQVIQPHLITSNAVFASTGSFNFGDLKLCLLIDIENDIEPYLSEDVLWRKLKAS